MEGDDDANDVREYDDNDSDDIYEDDDDLCDDSDDDDVDDYDDDHEDRLNNPITSNPRYLYPFFCRSENRFIFLLYWSLHVLVMWP